MKLFNFGLFGIVFVKQIFHKNRDGIETVNNYKLMLLSKKRFKRLRYFYTKYGEDE